MEKLEEIWKEIPKYPDYQISNLGSVLSIRRGRKILLKKTKDQHRRNKDLYYHTVMLYPANGRRRNFRVHSLVMLAFKGPTPEGMVITHKNDNTLDDALENLEFTPFLSIADFMQKSRWRGSSKDS